MPLAAFGQQQIIEEIQIHGNRRIPAETIRARMFTRAGDVYDPAALERDFSSLWNTGYFEDLRFEREESPKGYRLHVYVKEKPTIRSIEYRGLNSVTQSDVLEAFKKAKVGLTVENQYDPTNIKKAEVVIKTLLSQHGHEYATIRTEVHPIPPAAVGLSFVVREGPKVKVGRIRFTGEKKMKDRELRASMKNLKPFGIPHSIFFENLISRTYDATKLEEDTERVRDAMQQKGYFKAQVGDPETKIRDTKGGGLVEFWKKPGKRIDVTLPIDEGARYRLASITFKNNKAVPNGKALRALFPIKDGALLDTAKLRKGLENLRKGYGELGYINFSSVPDFNIDDAKKTVAITVDIDEGKPYSVRRIEFQGNTTTRDKVIRRELALDEGSVYNSRLWELSLLRLNQLQYFEQLKPDEDTEIKRNDQDGTVDLTLKVKEKGKNSIGLTGGISGLAGSFVGLNYSTNNFLGLGETLSVEADLGSVQRNITFGFTEPYFLDRPLQAGFSVYSRKYNYNQIQQEEQILNQKLNLPQNVLNTLQNFSQSSTGFTLSGSYALRHSFKRVGLTYGWDNSSVTTFSAASQQLFEVVAYRNISGPNALKGVITSKLIPSLSFSTIDNPQQPHRGKSLFLGADIAGIGGNVAYIRPTIEWKQFRPVHKGHDVFGYRFLGSFISGYRGLAAPPSERFYSGGENDLRGFDIRTVSPYVYLAGNTNMTLTNPDGSGVPINPANPRAGFVTVPVPVFQLTVPGGDTNLIGNFEYRVPIVGPVTIAAFTDIGTTFIARQDQLRLTDQNLATLNSTAFGCPAFLPGTGCTGGTLQSFSRDLKPVAGTNFLPRLSTGLELQVILPIVNAPFRIYYAYNPLLLDTRVHTPFEITRSMFPAGSAGDFTFQTAQQLYGTDFRLKEPRKTFRFTVATTF